MVCHDRELFRLLKALREREISLIDDTEVRNDEHRLVLLLMFLLTVGIDGGERCFDGVGVEHVRVIAVLVEQFEERRG